ncbi:DM13 domain-containing protein [Candidatus Woesearchaeota archaeon]|nr:DM13 domain-containing protein [Candidatus Woesearchaeota archaeon]
MKKLASLIITISVLAILWYLLSPLFFDKTVNEDAMGGTIFYEGNFTDADNFHKTSGKVLIIDNNLRLEDFETTNGPDLKVYLATDKEATDFINLGMLKGNIGNQNYEIPEGTDLEKYNYVLIWCRAFSTLFGSAELNSKI